MFIPAFIPACNEVKLSMVIDSYRDFRSQYVPPRTVEVCLPPGYHTDPAQRFPVLYMHDGQNLFDPALAYGGEAWEVDAAAQRLAAAGDIPELIIVGVCNSPGRWADYMIPQAFADAEGNQRRAAFAAATGADPRGDAYLRFLVEEVKPFIDAQYRTRPERAHTFVMGSSMGGLISLGAFCLYPDVFGGAGCVSTHWPAAEGAMVAYLARALPQPDGRRLYFDYGTETLDALYEPYQQRVDALMRAAGYTEGVDWVTYKFEGAEHSERSWRARVHIPLTFLLGNRA